MDNRGFINSTESFKQNQFIHLEMHPVKTTLDFNPNQSTLIPIHKGLKTIIKNEPKS